MHCSALHAKAATAFCRPEAESRSHRRCARRQARTVQNCSMALREWIAPTIFIRHMSLSHKCSLERNSTSVQNWTVFCSMRNQGRSHYGSRGKLKFQEFTRLCTFAQSTVHRCGNLLGMQRNTMMIQTLIRGLMLLTVVAVLSATTYGNSMGSSNVAISDASGVFIIPGLVPNLKVSNPGNFVIPSANHDYVLGAEGFFLIHGKPNPRSEERRVGKEC